MTILETIVHLEPAVVVTKGIAPLVAAGLISAIPGLIQGVGSLFGGRKRRTEQRQAQNQFDTDVNNLRNFQFSNPYTNLENTAEDLTINQQAFQAQAQQSDQVLSSALDAVVASGGGGGGAQAIANAALESQQGRSASIQQQEQANNLARTQEASRLQGLEAGGDARLQAQQYGQLQQQQDFSGQRLGAANAARQQATSAAVQGFGSAAGSIAGGFANNAAANKGFNTYNQAQNTLGQIQSVNAINPVGIQPAGGVGGVIQQGPKLGEITNPLFS